MSTTTSRLGMVKADTTDIVNLPTQINNNLDLLDGAVGCFVCTSSTRPTGGQLFHGLLIKETDTGNKYYWNSGSVAWLAF